MSDTDVARVLLIDAENVIGPFKPRLALVRTRVQALLTAAGPIHHALACYGQQWPVHDTVPSALIELGVVPWPVPLGPDAAEIALVSHARYLATRPTRWCFFVASGDHRLAQIAEYGEVHVVVWEGHPLAARLQSAAAAVYRLPRTTTAIGSVTAPLNLVIPTGSAVSPTTSRVPDRRLTEHLITALITGVGIGLGHRVVDGLRPRRPHR